MRPALPATSRRSANCVSDDPGLANARIAGTDGVERSMVHVASDWPGRFPNVGATLRALASAGADVNARMSPRPQDPNCVETPAGTGPPAATTSVLAESLRADLLLIDEPAGRKRAQKRGLAARGTLGVLVEARKWGVHPSLKPVLDPWTAEGFRIAPALVRDALAYVGERHHRRMLHVEPQVIGRYSDASPWVVTKVRRSDTIRWDD